MFDGISWPTLLAFAGTCLVIELTPGPNMAYLAVLSTDKGRRAGFAALVGVALGLFLVGIAAAVGLAAVVDRSPFLYELLRWGGTFYLLYLAWEAWHASNGPAGDSELTLDQSFRFFLRGLITNLLNPKAAIFYVAVLPTFITAERAVAQQAIALSMVYVSVATLVHSCIVLIADAARPLLENSKKSENVRRASALLLVVIAIWMLFATRHV